MNYRYKARSPKIRSNSSYSLRSSNKVSDTAGAGCGCILFMFFWAAALSVVFLIPTLAAYYLNANHKNMQKGGIGRHLCLTSGVIISLIIYIGSFLVLLRSFVLSSGTTYNPIALLFSPATWTPMMYAILLSIPFAIMYFWGMDLSDEHNIRRIQHEEERSRRKEQESLEKIVDAFDRDTTQRSLADDWNDDVCIICGASLSDTGEIARICPSCGHIP